MLVFLAFISKTVNNQCYNPYIARKISKRSFQKCMGCSIYCLPFSRKTQKTPTPKAQLLSWRLCFWRLSRKRLTINATTHIFLERSRKDLSIKVWVIALIVYRFRDKQSMLQPIPFWIDLEKIFPKIYGL